MMRLIKQILDWNNLTAAWNQVAKAKGAAGSDGVSVKRWGRNWEERLVELRRAVMGNTYRPAPLERFTVPKRSGGVRHMTNLTVTDKVLQRAVLNVLDDIFENIFLDSSFGYRPGRSLGDAVETIVKHRDMALEWVLDADIDGRLTPPTPKNIPARQAQYRTAQDLAFCLEVARAIVAGKLRNSRTMARRQTRWREGIDERPIAEITRCLKKLPAAIDMDQIRGLEGQGARAYFQIWRQAFGGALRFERRTRRPPKDPINAMLGLGYSLLTQNLMTACEVVGLDPYDGFFHADKYGRPALALDLVEEFRAVVVDSVVQTMVNKQIVDEEDFVSSQGGVYLKRTGLGRFFEQYSHRLQTRVVHPYYNRRLSYQQCFEVQARLLRKVIQGELDEYPPFRVK